MSFEEDCSKTTELLFNIFQEEISSLSRKHGFSPSLDAANYLTSYSINVMGNLAANILGKFLESGGNDLGLKARLFSNFIDVVDHCYEGIYKIQKGEKDA